MNLNQHGSTNQYRYFGIGILLFIYFVMTLYPYLWFPPVWDAAAGLFAPAIYLYETGGNYGALLSESGYVDAGPNVHSASVFTYFLYLLIRCFEGDTDHLLPTLHLMQFVFAASIAAMTWRLVSDCDGELTALASVVALISMPLFLVQVSYIYTELPGALLTLSCLLCWYKRQYTSAVLCAVLAILLKQTGIFVIVGLGFLLLADRNQLGLLRKIGLLSGLVISGIIVIGINSMYGYADESGYFSYGLYLKQLWRYVAYVPDLLILIIVLLIAICLLLFRYGISNPRIFCKKIDNALRTSGKARLMLGAVVFAGAFISLMVTAYFFSPHFFPLPRYYVWVVPILIIIVAISIQEWLIAICRIRGAKPMTPKVIFLISSACAIVYLQANRGGAFYPYSPGPFASFSVVERSFEYQDFFNIQSATVKYAAENYSDWPIFVTRGEKYFMSSRVMGYLEDVPGDVRFILRHSNSIRNPERIPEKFIIIDANSNDYHGANMLETLAETALDSNRFLGKEVVFKSGFYTGRVLIFDSSLDPN